MTHKIRIFVDQTIANAEQVAQHLNRTTPFTYIQEQIPNSGYIFEGITIKMEALLSSAEKSSLPTIFVTDRRAAAQAQVDPDGNWAIISFFSYSSPDLQTLALTIAAGTLELLDKKNFQGLLGQACENLVDALSATNNFGREILNGVQRPFLPNIHVLVTHGIRTRAPWTESARKTLGDSFGYEFMIFRYGFITLFYFLGSRTIQDGLAHKLLVRLIELKAQSKDGKLGVIVHSYGSLLLAKALSQAEELKIDLDLEAVVMNGSILPVDYDWSSFTDSTKTSGIRIRRVLNICGDKDIWPLLASKFAPNAGGSGTYFFSVNSPQIANLRIEDCGHSDMLNSTEARNIWGRFINDSGYHPSTQVDLAKRISMVNFITSQPFLLFTLVLLAVFLFWFY